MNPRQAHVHPLYTGRAGPEASRYGNEDPWCRRHAVATRLFCFPYAGGSNAVFSDWADSLPPSVELIPVQPPGRWTERQLPLTRIEEVVDCLVPRLWTLLDLPFAFFGHSLGALVAYELTRNLRRRGHPLPRHLYMSGHRAPHYPSTARLSENATDEELVAHITELGGTPPEVLADQELLQLMLPTLRADFAICRNYRWVTGPPLPCPITVFAGAEDDDGADAFVSGWQAHTTHPLARLTFPGGHFFLHTARESLLVALRTSLTSLVERSGAVGEG